MTDLQQLTATLAQAGLPGLLLALLILVGVFLLKRGGLVISGHQARLANLILAVLLSGLNPASPEVEKGLTAVIGAILSALVYELSQLAQGKPNAIWRKPQ